tara:strand:+ start:146 stop:508 length:363 start_codon:yes stop_codon:yes gene_type:complete
MNDFYIKLANEAAMPTVLSAFYKQDYSTIVDPETGVESTQIEGEPYFVSSTADYAIDVVGVLHEATGNTLTEDAMEYPEMAALDGWHVNIRLSSETMRDAVEALDVSHGVTPDAPRRVWL